MVSVSMGFKSGREGRLGRGMGGGGVTLPAGPHCVCTMDARYQPGVVVKVPWHVLSAVLGSGVSNAASPLNPNYTDG